jgi:signal transduction histidine kinase
LHDTIEMLKNIDQMKKNVVIREILEGPLFVEADAQKMKQVFWNLGTNAVDAMKDGGALTVSTRTFDDSVGIVFADTGVGIDPYNIEKVFYPFFTTKETGTGLGLAIAYRIIVEHMGRLTVRSKPGTETAFEIILPLRHGKK